MVLRDKQLDFLHKIKGAADAAPFIFVQQKPLEAALKPILLL